MNSRTAKAKHFLIGSISVVDFVTRAQIAAGLDACAVRLFDVVGELGEPLSMSKVPAHASMGYYFKGHVTLRAGKGNLAEAEQCFDIALSLAPSEQRERIILAQSIPGCYKGDRDARIKACERAASASDYSTRIEALRGLAVALDENGEHYKALSILESNIPVIKDASYYAWMNSLAVALASVGRLEDAEKAAAIALTSPHANAFPEFEETYQDIKLRQHRAPLVSVTQIRRPSNGSTYRNGLRAVPNPKPTQAEVEFARLNLEKHELIVSLGLPTATFERVSRARVIVEGREGER